MTETKNSYTQDEVDKLKAISEKIHPLLVGLTYGEAEKVLYFTNAILREGNDLETVKDIDASVK